MESILTDNGGEFSAEEIREVMSFLDVKVLTTAAQSPFQNGLCEKVHSVTDNMLVRLKEQYPEVKEDVLLKWANMARNSLKMWHGFSSYQLVFGKNPNVPNIITNNNPSALNDKSISEMFVEHLNVLHAARRAFIESESCERLRRALRSKIRASEQIFSPGERVYYKREGQDKWLGPAKVIFQDGKVVFVRHGSVFVRVSVNRIVKSGDELDVKTLEEEMPEKQSAREVKCSAKKHHEETHMEETHNEDTHSRETPNGETHNEDTHSEETHNEDTHSDEMCSGSQLSELNDGDHTNQNNQLTENPCANLCMENELKRRPVLRKGDMVMLKMIPESDWERYRVLGRAGKAKGPLQSWYNVMLEETGEAKSVDLDTVAEWKKTEEVNLEMQLNRNGLEETESNKGCRNENPLSHEDIYRREENVLTVDTISWKAAKEKELDSWKENSVYVEVPDAGQNCISTRWVCTLKETANGPVPKARLVVRGFEENQDVPADSPTCSVESLRVILTVMAMKGWQPRSMDIKTAFLQGKTIDRELFIRPPKEADVKEVLWMLKKCAYGLCDASLQWYHQVRSVMTDFGANVSRMDPAVFSWHDGGNLIGLLACHVDDFLWSGSQEFGQVMERVRRTFKVGKEDNGMFRYIGLEISDENEGIYLHQDRYAQSITPLPLLKSRAGQKDANLSDQEKDLLKSKIGQLLWIARQSRPDVLFDTCDAATSIKHATIRTVQEVNKIVKQIRADKVMLKFQKLQEKNLQLIVFTDSSLGNLSDGGTQGGLLIFLRDLVTGKTSPICWTSRKIRRIVRSSLAAETLALSDGIDMAMFIKALCSELLQNSSVRILAITDCKSLCDAISSTKPVTERRLRLEMSAVKELVQREQVEVIWVETKQQVANCLTKRGASPLSLLQILEDGWMEI